MHFSILWFGAGKFSYLGLIMGISKVMFSTTVEFNSQGFWEA